MKILVIEDRTHHAVAAHETLQDHEVTVVQTIAGANKILKNKEVHFDALLTDLFMPLGSFTGDMNTEKYPPPRGELPAGLIFALKASNLGIRTVIVTDTNHHDDWICTLLDLIYEQYQRPEQERRVAFVEARNVPMNALWDATKMKLVPMPAGRRRAEDMLNDGPTVKDWLKAMHRSELFPELEEKPALDCP